MNTTLITRYAACVLAVWAISCSTSAQYYYKDIVVTAQINANYRALRDNKVTQITLNPAGGDPDQAAVTLQQTIHSSQRLVVTYTKVPNATESWLKSYYNAEGLLQKTVDSSADFVNTSLYEYDASGRLSLIRSNAVPVNDPAETETHKWSYNSNGQPVQMLKIKSGNDTTFISYTADEQGNP